MEKTQTVEWLWSVVLGVKEWGWATGNKTGMQSSLGAQFLPFSSQVF